ncbi:MAG: N-acetylmuramoyl-L-alanine amidase, partial [Desulfovibrionaceae bacterium]|nr:N-acetylmuramoyl-L-alanine amidase [Desulfovibrionaceae bacterium]
SRVAKGPVRHINVIKAKVKGAGGKTVPSCRVELTLKGDYPCSVSAPKGKAELHFQVNSAKKQNSSQSGRGVAGKIESQSCPQAASPSHPTSKAEMLGLTVETILLDPGHGGKDPGAKANGIQESNLVLKIAKMVESRLKKRGFRVSYTRDKNIFIPLEKRTETANRRKVDLFVSIHVNANTDASVAGLETYYLDKARSKSAERVAARENGVSVAKIDDLQVILTDLGLGTKMRESHDLAQSVQKNMERQVKSGGYTVRSHGVRSAPFYVLMGAKMPAILIEVGYCTNKKDANYLKNDKYLNRIADGITEGIAAYKKNVESSVE